MTGKNNDLLFVTERRTRVGSIMTRMSIVYAPTESYIKYRD